MAWEELHSGAWEHVSVAWREAYTLATVSSAIESLQASVCKADTTACDWKAQTEACLRSLDVSLLVGGPRLADVVHSFISSLHTSMLAASGTGTAHQSSGPTSDTHPALQTSALEVLAVAGPPVCSRTCTPTVPCSRRLSTLEAVAAPDILGFEHRFMNRSEPCLMDGVAESWPAMDRCVCRVYISTLHLLHCPLLHLIVDLCSVACAPDSAVDALQSETATVV